jgi:hypothetical protein
MSHSCLIDMSPNRNIKFCDIAGGEEMLLTDFTGIAAKVTFTQSLTQNNFVFQVEN